MTDLKRHSDFINRRLKPLIPKGHKAHRDAVAAGSGAIEWRSPLKEPGTDAIFALTICVKFADLGHVVKPFRQHQQWTRRATEEFWSLGDKEKALGVAVSPLCDRTKDTDVARSQIGFFKFVCNPFYKVVFDLLDPNMAPAAHNRDNYWTWFSEVKMKDDDTQSVGARAKAPSPTGEDSRQSGGGSASKLLDADVSGRPSFKATPSAAAARRKSLVESALSSVKAATLQGSTPPAGSRTIQRSPGEGRRRSLFGSVSAKR